MSAAKPPPPPTAAAECPQHPPAVLFAVAFLMSGCFGVISQALPAALMQAVGSARAATTTGYLLSLAGLVEVCLSNSFGRLTDAIGRKPILLAAPAVAVAARAVVVRRLPRAPTHAPPDT